MPSLFSSFSLTFAGRPSETHTNHSGYPLLEMNKPQPDTSTSKTRGQNQICPTTLPGTSSPLIAESQVPFV
jgi:hypothetical protein